MYKFLLFLLFATQTISPHAITYELNGGRLGDNLSTYCKAKWLSYKFGIPLLYKSFEYSDQLHLHTADLLFSEELKTTFDAIIKVNSMDDIKNNKKENVLFVTNFYTQTPGLYEYSLQDAQFAQEIKRLLTPNTSIEFPEKEKNCITVALHVRTGGGFDPKNSAQKWPTKFPPHSYYLQQLKTLRKLTESSLSLKIYLFTDDANPGEIVKNYAQELNDSTISFEYRKEDNAHDANVVEDFYAMAQCDCLIRSSSLLAKATELLGAYSIIMYPPYGYWDTASQSSVINPLGIYYKPSLCQGFGGGVLLAHRHELK
jgi:hypothetical protein